MKTTVGVMLAVLVLFVWAQEGFGGEQEQINIDEIMKVKQGAIEVAFSDFSKSKAASKLVEIERLNEDTGKSLIEWWDTSQLPCCIEKNADPKEIWKKNRAKFRLYLKNICNNYTRIAAFYAESNMTTKAQTLYRYVTEAFDDPDFDRCVQEARLKSSELKN